MATWRYADAWQEPTRRGLIRGTVRQVTFPSGGGVARQVMPMDLDQAILHFDPFQK